MKISKEQYAALKSKLDQTIEIIGISRARYHRYNNEGKDKEVRFRWDLYHAANGHSVFRCDRDICDDHIDTALKRYVQENILLN